VGKSENGPDMRDCGDYAQAIQESASCTISVLLEPVTKRDVTSWRAGAVACSRVLTVDGPSWSAAVTVHWPSQEHREFAAALYGVLASLDAEITRKAFQEALHLA